MNKKLLRNVAVAITVVVFSVSLGLVIRSAYIFHEPAKLQRTEAMGPSPIASPVEQLPSSAHGMPANVSVMPLPWPGATLPPSPVALRVPLPRFLTKSLTSRTTPNVFGKIAFNPPPTMTQYDRETIEVRITRTQMQTFATGMEGKGPVQTLPIKIGPVMKVSLTGAGFDINRVKPAPDENGNEYIWSSDFGDWVFVVTPQEAGDLLLTLDAEISIEGASAPLYERVLKKMIHVGVRPGQPWRQIGGWISNNLLVVLTIILIMLAALAVPWAKIWDRFLRSLGLSALPEDVAKPDLWLSFNEYGPNPKTFEQPPEYYYSLTAEVSNVGVRLVLYNLKGAASDGGGLVRLWIPLRLLNGLPQGHIGPWENKYRTDLIGNEPYALFHFEYTVRLYPEVAVDLPELRLGTFSVGDFKLYYQIATSDRVYPSLRKRRELRLHFSLREGFATADAREEHALSPDANTLKSLSELVNNEFEKVDPSWRSTPGQAIGIGFGLYSRPNSEKVDYVISRARERLPEFEAAMLRGLGKFVGRPIRLS